MRCPECGADNSDDATQCSSCGVKLARRPRRRPGTSDSSTPFSTGPDTRSALALAAYRCSVIGLVPFLGLLFGPLGAVLGLVAWRQERAGASGGPANAAIVLGCLETLTNWLGLLLMIVGLR